MGKGREKERESTNAGKIRVRGGEVFVVYDQAGVEGREIKRLGNRIGVHRRRSKLRDCIKAKIQDQRTKRYHTHDYKFGFDMLISQNSVTLCVPVPVFFHYIPTIEKQFDDRRMSS